MRIDRVIGAPAEKEKTAGGIGGGAPAGENIEKPDPEKWQRDQAR
jgi:hypothetical protein